MSHCRTILAILTLTVAASQAQQVRVPAVGEIRNMQSKTLKPTGDPDNRHDFPDVTTATQVFLITQVCVGNGLGTEDGTIQLQTGPESTTLLWRSHYRPWGCTTFSPGIVWPHGNPLRVISTTSAGEVYVTVIGVITPASTP